jgi:hypothetical protein
MQNRRFILLGTKPFENPYFEEEYLAFIVSRRRAKNEFEFGEEVSP